MCQASLLPELLEEGQVIRCSRHGVSAKVDYLGLATRAGKARFEIVPRRLGDHNYALCLPYGTVDDEARIDRLQSIRHTRPQIRSQVNEVVHGHHEGATRQHGHHVMRTVKEVYTLPGDQ